MPRKKVVSKMVAKKKSNPKAKPAKPKRGQRAKTNAKKTKK